MNKEIYVKEMPKCCGDCEFCSSDYYNSYCLKLCTKLGYINKDKDCPLKSLHDHDRELVKEVCEKIRERYNLEGKPITDAFGDTQYGYVMVSAKDLKQFLDQIQKECMNDTNI